MKQIIQNYRTGELQMVEVSIPAVKGGMLIVHTMASLVSIGTKKAMIDVAKKSLLGKALARPPGAQSQWRLGQILEQYASGGSLI